MKNLYRIFLDLAYLPFFLASKILPNFKEVWLFGSWNGEGFKDSSRWLYEYVYNDKKYNVNAYWILESSSFIYEVPKKYRKNILIKGTIKWLIYCCICRVVFYSHSPKGDIGLIVNRDDVLKVQLWHGCPMKMVGSDDVIYTNKTTRKRNKIIKLFSSLLMPYRSEKHDIVFSLSDYDKNIFERIFSPKLGCLKFGYPRNDCIKNKELLIKNKSKDRNILYAPTFRKTLNPSLKEYGLTMPILNKINHELSVSGLILKVRLHPAVNINTKETAHFTNIIFINNKQDIVFDIIKSDALITDYSSIAFDYLLHEKPIFFLLHDLQVYENNHRMFYPGIIKNMCNPAFISWDEVISQVTKTFVDNDDEFNSYRKQIIEKYLENTNGDSCKRIYEWVTGQINLKPKSYR